MDGVGGHTNMLECSMDVIRGHSNILGGQTCWEAIRMWLETIPTCWW